MFRTDEIYWYNPPGAPWGALGYAAPNFGDNPITLNADIHYLVSVMGRNLQALMIHADADLRRPPSINTLTRIHKLIVRARSILSSRAVPEGKPKFEAQHSTPAPRPFVIFPCPYWHVRNAWLADYAGLILQAVGEACQHTETRVQHEITMGFSGLIGSYLQRVYKRMATELFGVSIVDAEKPDFTLSDTQLSGYDPTKFFTSTEMIDLPPDIPFDLPTEDDLRVLTDGIAATQLTGLQRWPSGVAPSVTGGVAASEAYSGAPPSGTAAASSVAFAPPPGP